MPAESAPQLGGLWNCDEPVLVAVQAFYARQAQALNDGDFEGYEQSFTANAEFEVDGLHAPLRGAVAIAQHSKRLYEARTAAGEIQRHVVTMSRVEWREATVLWTRSYTSIVLTGSHSGSVMQGMALCEDLLSVEHGHCRVMHRRVVRDGGPVARISQG
jgi:3-phenylpropionate/cinnamic acid dioxygenase small subunit